MSTPRSLGRRLLLGLAGLVAVVVLAVVLVLVLVSSGAVTKRAVDLVLPSVSRSLGREVTLKEAKLRLFPNPRVTLAGLAVAGRPGEPALVDSEGLEVEVGLWPLVRSLGNDIEVRAFRLVKPSVNLVKAKDGTWNFEGLGAPPAEAGKAPAPGKPPAPAPAAGAPGAKVAVALVRIEQAAIKVIDRSQGGDDQALALDQLDLEARGVGPGLPLEARLDAALADTRQNLHARLAVARLPEGVPARPEDWPEVQGSLQLAALALARFHALLPGDVGAIVRGGVASLDAKLTTTAAPQRGYRVEGTGELKDVRLRGQSSSGRFRAAAAWSPAKPDAARVDVTDLALRGPGVDLGGNLSLETPPMRAWFVLTGSLLDLDAVMGVLPDAPAEKAAEKPAAAAPAPAGDLVPAATRKEIRAASARGTIALERLKAGRIDATDVKAKAILSNGTLTLEDLSASLLGGRVSAAGSRVALSEKVPSWKLAADLSGLDLEKTLTAFTGRAPLLGRLDGRLDVEGVGTEWEKLRDAVTGLAALSVKEGTLTTTDLGDSVLGGLSKALEAAGKGGLARKAKGAEGGKTSFRDLAGKFLVKDGGLTAQSPIQLGSSAGQLALGGRIGLDGGLGLEGRTAVPKAVLAEVVSGIPLPEKLEIPIAIGGTLQSPSVSVKAEQAAGSLLKGSAKAAAQDVREKAEEKGKKAVEGLLKRFGK